MLQSLLTSTVERDLFAQREIDDASAYLRIASALGAVLLYVYVRSYYAAPFRYDTPFGLSARAFVIFAVALGLTTFLVTYFYSREVLRVVYERSIDVAVGSLPFDAASRISIERDLRDDLRRSLQLTLSRIYP